MNTTPRFAITGHPNKGKSSIVATLAEDESVAISDVPGTTGEARVYPMCMDGETLYELVDTPGFQRAREVLEWLKVRVSTAVDRHAAVADFVVLHRSDPRFHVECELLQPIIEGAGILYVVDGARPYGPEYECEMQILQWTGQPRMALINLIGGDEHVQSWQRALDQYFSVVRVFDAQRADFNKRIELLDAFATLRESWSDSIQRAIEVLKTNRVQRLNQAASEIADLLLSVMCMQETAPLPDDEADSQLQALLAERLQDRIRDREKQSYDLLQQICGHSGLSRSIDEMPLLQEDLFSEQSFVLFGLSNTQLALTGAASGAIAGGGVDMLVGGASFFLGAGIGALLGGVGVLIGARQIAGVEIMGMPMGGYQLEVGPVANPNFPWVVLGRAILFFRLVSERNHARRESLIVTAKTTDSLSESLGHQQRVRLHNIFKSIRKRHNISHEDLNQLIAQLAVLCK